MSTRSWRGGELAGGPQGCAAAPASKVCAQRCTLAHTSLPLLLPATPSPSSHLSAWFSTTTTGPAQMTRLGGVSGKGMGHSSAPLGATRQRSLKLGPAAPAACAEPRAWASSSACLPGYAPLQFCLTSHLDAPAQRVCASRTCRPARPRTSGWTWAQRVRSMPACFAACPGPGLFARPLAASIRMPSSLCA